MKKIFTLFLVTLTGLISHAQTTLFWEDFGTVIDSLANRPSWTNGGPASNNLNIVINTQDTPAIAGGSGMGNLIEGRTSGTVTGIATYTMKKNVVSTVGFTDIKVLWANRKTSSYTGTVTLEWSADSISWNNLPFLPDTAVNPPRWVLANEGVPVVLPAAANGLPNLQFRFTFNRTVANNGNYRIDDFKVFGTPVATSITPVPGNTNEMSIQATPNPFKGAVVITHPPAGNNAQIEVLNTSGALLFLQKPARNSKATLLNLEKMGAGMLIIRFTDSNKSLTTRVVKN